MRIHEVIIQVGDVDAAVRFYTEGCGLRLVRTVTHEGSPVAELDAGGQRVTLIPAGAPGVVLALSAGEDLSAEGPRLAEAGATLDAEEPVALEGGAWLPFRDPWGNRLGLWRSAGT